MSFSQLKTLDDVKQNTSGYTRMWYQEVTASKPVEGSNFKNNLVYKIQNTGNAYAFMNESYFGGRTKITRDGTAQPVENDFLAPAPFYMSGLFNGCDFYVNGKKTVSAITDNLPQIEACRYRQSKSNIYRQTAGRTNFMSGSFEDRQKAISVDTSGLTLVELGVAGTETVGVSTAGVVTFDAIVTKTYFKVGDRISIKVGAAVAKSMIVTAVPQIAGATAVTMTVKSTDGTATTVNDAVITTNVLTRIRDDGYTHKNSIQNQWQPAHPIFQMAEPLPPNGNYSVVMSPNSLRKNTAALQTIEGTSLTTAAINVEEMVLYVLMVEGVTPPSDYTYYLDLTSVEAHTAPLVNVNGKQKFTFNVPTSTYALSVATQSQSAGESTSYPPQIFKQANGKELEMTDLTVKYANQTKPESKTDIKYSDTSKEDWLIKQYNDTMRLNGSFKRAGGAESYEDWLTNFGPLYSYNFLKPYGDKSSIANVTIDFDSAPTEGNLILFSWSKSVTQVVMENDQVKSVQEADF